MKFNLVYILAILAINLACSTPQQTKHTEQWKQEIVQAEEDFAAMADSLGIGAAFLSFAAEDAVLMRNNRLIIGKPALTDHFDASEQVNRNMKLKWAPDFVDVSSSGDLGYTFGKYAVTYPDSTGNLVENSGVFHTVWKRQSDGSWKFVWD